MMRIAILWGVLCWADMAGAFADNVPPAGAGLAPTNRVLEIDESFTKLPGGKATLVLGLLRRTNDVFGGEFHMKVTPYFFKNEKGTLAININDEMIAKAAKGTAVDVTGLATSSDGTMRDITALATPVDEHHGSLKLWFMAKERKMVFETKYRFVE